MRLRVWAVAGFDTVKFLAGMYAEPTHMRLPLRDSECRQCHTPILTSIRPPSVPDPPSAVTPGSEVTPAEAIYGAQPQDEGRGGTAFHSIRDHDTVDLRCIRCHTSHTTDGDGHHRFLTAARLKPICRECHPAL